MDYNEHLLYHLLTEYRILTTGMIPDKVREKGVERVLHNAAFSNSMISYFTSSQIASLLGVIRTKVQHYQTVSGVYEQMPLYNKFFSIAESIKQTIAQSNNEVDYLEKQVKRFETSISKNLKRIEELKSVPA